MLTYTGRDRKGSLAVPTCLVDQSPVERAPRLGAVSIQNSHGKASAMPQGLFLSEFASHLVVREADGDLLAMAASRYNKPAFGPSQGVLHRSLQTGNNCEVMQ